VAILIGIAIICKIVFVVVMSVKARSESKITSYEKAVDDANKKNSPGTVEMATVASLKGPHVFCFVCDIYRSLLPCKTHYFPPQRLTREQMLRCKNTLYSTENFEANHFKESLD
jgi:hypothetical protein